MKETIKLLKENFELARIENIKLTQSLSIQSPIKNYSLNNVIQEGEIPSVYMKAVIKEREQLMDENKSLKNEVSILKIELNEKKNEIQKLQAVIKRYNKIIEGFDSGELLNRKLMVNKSMVGISDENSECAQSSITKLHYISKSTDKLEAFSTLMESIMKTENIARVISLIIK